MVRTLQKARKLRKTAKILSVFLLFAVPIGLIVANHFRQGSEAVNIASINPSSGPIAGGQSVTIEGDFPQTTIPNEMEKVNTMISASTYGMDENGSVWVLEQDGSSTKIYDATTSGSSMDRINFQSSASGFVYGVDENGSVWAFGQNNSPTKVYDAAANGSMMHQMNLSASSSSAAYYVYGVDVDGNVWAFSQASAATKVYNAATNGSPMSNMNITSSSYSSTLVIYGADAAGNVWAFRQASAPTKVYDSTANGASMSQMNVTSYTILGQSTTWVFGVDSAGNVWQFQATTAATKKYDAATNGSAMSRMNVTSTLSSDYYLFGIDVAGNVWAFSSTNNPLKAYNAVTQGSPMVQMEKMNASSNYYIYGVDAAGNVWAFTNSSSSTKAYNSTTNASPIVSMNISSDTSTAMSSSYVFGVDNNGNVWAFTGRANAKKVYDAAVNGNPMTDMDTQGNISYTDTYLWGIDIAGNVWSFYQNNNAVRQYTAGSSGVAMSRMGVGQTSSVTTVYGFDIDGNIWAFTNGAPIKVFDVDIAGVSINESDVGPYFYSTSAMSSWTLDNEGNVWKFSTTSATKVYDAEANGVHYNYTVSFGGVNCQITNKTDNAIVCFVPAASQAGKVKVSVNNGVDSPAVLVDGYTYYEPMSVDGITSDKGLDAGGTEVTLTGSGIKIENKNVVHVSAGYFHSLALTDDGKIYSWGRDIAGQLGDGGTNTDQPTPVAVDMTGALNGKVVTAIAAGGVHSLALTSDGEVYSWGQDWSGTLGDGGTNTDQPAPVAVDMTAVPADKTVTAIAAGWLHSFALTSDGKVYSWGNNRDGQLGNGGYADQPTPVAVDMSGALAGKTVTAISAGYFHSLALTSDGEVYSWGHNDFGQLGNGSVTPNQPTPVAVDTIGAMAGKTVTAISASGGDNFSLALTSDGGVYGWGRNDYYQLGNGSDSTNITICVDLDNRNIDCALVPVAVDMSGVLVDKTVTTISAGGFHSLALTSDGKVYSWGEGYEGELGNSTILNFSPTPIAVDMTDTFKTATVIAAGRDYSLAIASDGKVQSWGYNLYGQLGRDPVVYSYGRIPGDVDIAPFNIIFDAVGAPAVCRDIATGANNITTNIASDGSGVKCVTSAHVADTVDVTISNGVDNVVKSQFYTYEALYLTLNLNTNLLEIGDPTGLSPTTSGIYATGTNILTTTTNNPKGYTLSLSTNELSTNNPNAKDLKHSFLDQYIVGTTNTCSWDNTYKTLTNATNPLVNNTWGFTIDSTNRDNQQLCQVPSKDHQLTIRATDTDNNELGDTINLYYGTRVDLAKPSGVYRATVMYTVTGGM